MNPTLKQIADNPALLEALRKFLYTEFDFDIAKMDLTLPNDVLGQVLRARTEGWAIVEGALSKIERFKTVPESPERINQAR